MAGLWSRVRLWSIRAGIVVSIVYAAVALSAAYRGDVYSHAAFMVPGGLVLFASVMAYAYSAPVLHRLGGPAEAAGVLVVAALSAFPLLAYSRVPAAWLFYTTPAVVVAVLTALGAVRLRNTIARASYMHISLSYIVSSVLAFIAYSDAGIRGAAVALTYSLLLPLVYAVSFQSFTMTCGLKPVLWLLPASTAASLVSGVAAITGSSYAGPAALISMVLYIIGARLYEVKRCMHGGKAARRYFAIGHIAVLVATVLSIYAIAGGTGPYALHTVLIGFVGVHIAVHAPMMVPVVVGLSNARRFTPLPYVLLLAAVPAWSYSCRASMLLLVAWLFFTVAIVAGRRRLR
ncbi:MAG TPA: hypothetical protein EYH50_02890 [Pyrodictium delaneyi]|uniref:Uncharacterized protein n=1 Tax=Pyrodictium delaneyi TaxID=1273541 RepID=A0A832ZUK6_9CREN|nr:hypothetical protein [Pyrodictium delaneyi]